MLGTFRKLAAALIAASALAAPAGATVAQPTDPDWSLQWGWRDQSAPAAWSLTAGSPTVTVAVLDTGVDLSQPDLAGALAAGRDFVNGDDDPTDDHGHGTAIAGVIGARSDDGVGIAGWCPRCTVLPVKVAGGNGLAAMSTVAQGLVWAVDHGANVANISITAAYDDPALAAAVAYAQAHDVVVVAAAGNASSTTLQYPAAYPGVLSVAGSDTVGKLYSFSNRGASWVAVAAPGCVTAPLPGSVWVPTVCGTSFSAAMVSGIVALARSYAPTADAARIVAAVEAGVTTTFGGDVRYGKVDAAAVLAQLTPRRPAAAKKR